MAVTGGIEDVEYPSTINPNKAEVFSMGITILSLGLLNSCEGVYQH